MAVRDFSLWCDFIHREFLEGEFRVLVDSGRVNGATSNPSIFAQSLKTPAYVDSIAHLKAQGLRGKALYENLALQDIARAAEILTPLYAANQAQGYVSIEIDPLLCDEAGASVDEGVRLYELLNKPNVMIKVPATQAGYEVMSALTSRGISVNATLIFSKEQALECARAMQSGFERARMRGLESHQGVISVFVSRFDRAVDERLEEAARARTGILNAMECYEAIEGLGQERIRTLFASTGVKGGGLRPSYYVDELVLPHSINTAPLETIHAVEALHEVQIPSGDERARFWAGLRSAGIERDDLAQNLLQEGLRAFKQSFEELLGGL